MAATGLCFHNPAHLVRQAASLTIASQFHASVSAHGLRVAIQQGGRCLTYEQLNERVNRLAHALTARGVAHGDRIAILSENRIEYVEMMLAAAKLGAIAACQNWRQADAELQHCLRLVAPKIAFVSERHGEALSRIEHGIDQVIMLGDGYERVLADSGAMEPQPVAEAEDALVILYTSGTTGLPKGAIISHRAMVARSIVQLLDRPATIDESFVAWTPMFHIGATDSVFSTLLRGAKIVVMDGFDAAALVQLIARERLSHLAVMPGVVPQLISQLRGVGLPPKGVRTVGAMADLVPPHLIAELTGLLQAPYVNTFGATESGAPPASKGMLPIGVVPQRLSKVQSSLCEIRLVDEHDCEVVDGEQGEIAMRGPTLFSGYWGAPEETAEDFRGGWFHLGDVMVRNADETLDFVDRRKYLIKSGGENIYPAEIERLLLRSPRIAEAVVLRRADVQWGEVPVALVVRRDEQLTAIEVIDFCRNQIASYKLPKEVRFVTDADLPRNASGKIMRHQCEPLFQPSP